MTAHPESFGPPREPLVETDEVLMGRFRAELDQRAMAELVARYTSPVLSICKHYLADTALAQDALQESLLRVVRHRLRYRPGSKFSWWYYAIVRNVCRDMLRRHKTRRAYHDKFGAEQPSSTPAREHHDMQGLLAHLAPIDQEILTLRFVHGLTLPDIALALGSNPEAVKKRAQRALRTLRSVLD